MLTSAAIPTGSRALLVEDDDGVRLAVDVALRHAGLQVVAVDSGERGLEAIGVAPFDVVVLDVMLPGLDGWGVCEALRELGHAVPILMLTALRDVEDRIKALDCGADDYVPKPFSVDELIARVGAMLRRVPPDTDGRRTVADLFIDQSLRVSVRGTRPLMLTKREFDLLAVLMDADGSVVSRERLLAEVWGDSVDGRSRTLDVYISYLRRKLEADGEARLVHTVRGEGFALRVG